VGQFDFCGRRRRIQIRSTPRFVSVPRRTENRRSRAGLHWPRSPIVPRADACSNSQARTVPKRFRRQGSAFGHRQIQLRGTSAFVSLGRVGDHPLWIRNPICVLSETPKDLMIPACSSRCTTSPGTAHNESGLRFSNAALSRRVNGEEKSAFPRRYASGVLARCGSIRFAGSAQECERVS
jgi:hypothetical protein